jgi:hypothetical protein
MGYTPSALLCPLGQNLVDVAVVGVFPCTKDLTRGSRNPDSDAAVQIEDVLSFSVRHDVNDFTGSYALHGNSGAGEMTQVKVPRV